MATKQRSSRILDEMHETVQGLHNAGVILSAGVAQQYDTWLAKKVEQSRASAKAGNLIPAADVEARFAARRAATRAMLASRTAR